MWNSCKRSSNLVSDLKRDKCDTFLLHSNWRKNYLAKFPMDINALSCWQKSSKNRKFRTPFTPRYFRKNPRSLYTPAPIIEMARAFPSSIMASSHAVLATIVPPCIPALPRTPSCHGFYCDQEGHEILGSKGFIYNTLLNEGAQ